MRKKYLFLDFDGVLHGINDGDIMLFRKSHYIEKLQKEFPNLKVILTTDWQIGSIFEEMQKFVSNIKLHHGTMYDKKFMFVEKPYISRYYTILEYIKEYNIDLKDCVIVDDNLTIFPELYLLKLKEENPFNPIKYEDKLIEFSESTYLNTSLEYLENYDKEKAKLFLNHFVLTDQFIGIQDKDYEKIKNLLNH